MAEDRRRIFDLSGPPVPETPKPGERPAPWGETRIVGKALPRVDAYERVSGSAVFPSDVTLPNMLHGAILRCPHPHAKVVRVDTGKARRMPGVRAVIDGSSPGADLLWTYSGSGTTVQTKIFDSVCRFEGETVAAVAAESPYQARDALRAIEVTYEVLPFVADERTALDPQSHPVHPGGNQVGKTDTYARGDVDRGFAEADVVLEADLPDRVRDPHPTGAPRVRGQLGGGPPDPLGVDPGGLCRPENRGRGPGPAPVQGPRHRPLHGRRVRQQATARQIHHHRGPPGPRSRPAGQDLPEPGGDLPGRGQPTAQQHDPQGRRQEGRHPHRPRLYLHRVRGRLPLRRIPRGRLAGPRPLRLPQCPDRRPPTSTSTPARPGPSGHPAIPRGPGPSSR